MPPRYAYWTILVDEQPTAFRAALQDDLMPTFKRLRERNPSARLVWFQNGKVWNSRLDAQEAMRARGERGRAGDARQRPGADRAQPRTKLEWQPKGTSPTRPKLDWRPRDPQGLKAPRPQALKTSKPRAPKASQPQALKASTPQTPKPSNERRNRNWRPGGEHRDPRQKYKDAKKAKWTRFKQTIRTRWEKKQGRKKDDE